jgi:GDP/UDP-N,N'-diacetylbacillosamine 2-epimerase (hydrolysing)
MKLLFVTGSRGEWGYIRPIVRLCEERGIEYEICATNMVVLPSHGSLIDEIKADGFKVSDEVFMSLEGHNHFTMVKSLGVFLLSFADILHRLNPDWTILAGDRGEQLMASIAGSFTYTPVAHIQAGERSGNIDGLSRHAIGKFVHLHFAANDDAAQRLIRMGEQAFRVHTVGAPQLDELVEGIVSTPAELAKKHNIDVERPYFLVVQHPVTEEMGQAGEQLDALIKGLAYFDMPIVWILPNNDAGSQVIRRGVMRARTRDIFVFENVSRQDYLGLLSNCACMVGNSSSGLLEAPTFKIPAVNLGRRQADRVQGKNVINAPFEPTAIKAAIEQGLSETFRDGLRDSDNPYGDGRSAERILDILLRTPHDDTLLIKELTY